MRILCLIMVGAFLLSIAIADNGNSLRLLSRPRAQQLRPLHQHQYRLNPGARLSRRTSSQSVACPHLQHQRQDQLVVASTQQEAQLPMTQAMQTAPVAQIQQQPVHEVQFLHQAAVPLQLAEGRPPVILERLSKPRKSSWTDWIPDFFLEDESSEATGPGPLIGPIDMPGMGGQVFIHEKRPSDDTERVVIHLVKRPPPLQILPGPHVFQQQPVLTHQFVGYPGFKESQLLMPVQEGNVPALNSVGPQYEIAKSEYHPQIIQENPWAQQANIQENEIKDEKSQKSTSERVIEIPKRDPQLQQPMLLKQTSRESPNTIWSQPFDGAASNGSSSLHRSPAYDEVQQVPHYNSAATGASSHQQQQLRRYSIQNSSRASSAEVLTGVEQQQQHQLRQPRNPYTLAQRLPQQHQLPTGRTSPATPVVGQGGLSVVPPPNLMSRTTAGSIRANSSADGSALVNSVMRLTANQTWRSPPVRSSGLGGTSAIGKKSSGLERKRPANPTKPPPKFGPSATTTAHYYPRETPIRRAVPVAVAAMVPAPSSTTMSSTTTATTTTTTTTTTPQSWVGRVDVLEAGRKATISTMQKLVFMEEGRPTGSVAAATDKPSR